MFNFKCIHMYTCIRAPAIMVLKSYHHSILKKVLHRRRYMYIFYLSCTNKKNFSILHPIKILFVCWFIFSVLFIQPVSLYLPRSVVLPLPPLWGCDSSVLSLPTFLNILKDWSRSKSLQRKRTEFKCNRNRIQRKNTIREQVKNTITFNTYSLDAIVNLYDDLYLHLYFSV